MTARYYVSPDGYGNETLWRRDTEASKPVAVLRRIDLPHQARYLFGLIATLANREVAQ